MKGEPHAAEENGVPAGSAIRVLLADDEVMTREAIAALLDLEPDITVVAQAGGGDGAVELARRHVPDVALLDVEMPGGGIEALARIRAQTPQTRPCILTRHARAGTLRRALHAGAAGFIAKSASARELADVVRRVAGGERYVDPFLAAEALAEPESPLTARELEVLDLVRIGLTTAQISSSLHLARGTVRNYLSAAIEKLGARTRYEAAEAAREAGWL